MKYGLDLTLKGILRYRPRAVYVLEEVAGPECWGELDSPLLAFCSAHGKDPETLLQIIANLPVDPHGSPWAEMPLSRLLDRLTVDHQRFRGIDLPDIESQLFGSQASEFPPQFPLESLRNTFHGFKIDFLLHMEEEEDFLFPHILRSEACLRYPELSSEAFRGSVSVYGNNMLRMPEAEIKDLARRLDELARQFPHGMEPGKADALATRVRDLLHAISGHADLETGVLMPAAHQIEKGLLGRRAA
jgi:iron-sulfur cluster repair protein YtfE (RIC family)